MRRRSLWLVPVVSIGLTAAATLVPSGDGDTGVGGITAGPAEARRRISIPFGFSDATLIGFDSTDLRPNERQVDVTGALTCGPGGRFRVDVTVVQDDVEAVGHTQGRCTGELETWAVRAVVRGPRGLQPGPAEGHGDARTVFGGQVTDTHQWDWEGTLT